MQQVFQVLAGSYRALARKSHGYNANFHLALLHLGQNQGHLPLHRNLQVDQIIKRCQNSQNTMLIFLKNGPD